MFTCTQGYVQRKNTLLFKTSTPQFLIPHYSYWGEKEALKPALGSAHPQRGSVLYSVLIQLPASKSSRFHIEIWILIFFFPLKNWNIRLAFLQSNNSSLPPSTRHTPRLAPVLTALFTPPPGAPQVLAFFPCESSMNFYTLVIILPVGKIQGVRTHTCQKCTFSRRISTKTYSVVSS